MVGFYIFCTFLLQLADGSQIIRSTKPRNVAVVTDAFGEIHAADFETTDQGSLVQATSDAVEVDSVAEADGNVHDESQFPWNLFGSKSTTRTTTTRTTATTRRASSITTKPSGTKSTTTKPSTTMSTTTRTSTTTTTTTTTSTTTRSTTTTSTTTSAEKSFGCGSGQVAMTRSTSDASLICRTKRTVAASMLLEVNDGPSSLTAFKANIPAGSISSSFDYIDKMGNAYLFLVPKSPNQDLIRIPAGDFRAESALSLSIGSYSVSRVIVQNNFAYFLPYDNSGYGNFRDCDQGGVVVRVNLDVWDQSAVVVSNNLCSDPQIGLNSARAGFSDGTYLYLLMYTNDPLIVRVALSDFNSPAATLNPSILRAYGSTSDLQGSWFNSMFTDGTYLYLLADGSVGYLGRFALSDFSSNSVQVSRLDPSLYFMKGAMWFGTSGYLVQSGGYHSNLYYKGKVAQFSSDNALWPSSCRSPCKTTAVQQAVDMYSNFTGHFAGMFGDSLYAYILFGNQKLLRFSWTDLTYQVLDLKTMIMSSSFSSDFPSGPYLSQGMVDMNGQYLYLTGARQVVRFDVSDSSLPWSQTYGSIPAAMSGIN